MPFNERAQFFFSAAECYGHSGQITLKRADNTNIHTFADRHVQDPRYVALSTSCCTSTNDAYNFWFERCHL